LHSEQYPIRVKLQIEKLDFNDLVSGSKCYEMVPKTYESKDILFWYQSRRFWHRPERALVQSIRFWHRTEGSGSVML